jgi:hypothetical protein
VISLKAPMPSGLPISATLRTDGTNDQIQLDASRTIDEPIVAVFGAETRNPAASWRHIGVTMFLLVLLHSAFAIIQFHAGGNLNPLVSVLTSYRREYLSFLPSPNQIAHFPFEAFGLLALLILFFRDGRHEP